MNNVILSALTVFLCHPTHISLGLYSENLTSERSLLLFASLLIKVLISVFANEQVSEGGLPCHGR